MIKDNDLVPVLVLLVMLTHKQVSRMRIAVDESVIESHVPEYLDQGVVGDHFDDLSLMLTHRTVGSKTRVGERISKAERARLRDKYRGTSFRDVNEFLESLPRDLLFVLRTNSIVRSVNHRLGGSSRERFLAYGRSAMRGLTLSSAVSLERPRSPTMHPRGRVQLNQSVDSENRKFSWTLMDMLRLEWSIFGVWVRMSTLELVFAVLGWWQGSSDEKRRPNLG